jgi:hypothetical protein
LDVDDNNGNKGPPSPRGSSGRSHHKEKAPRTPDAKQQQRLRDKAVSRAQMSPEEKVKEQHHAAKMIQQSFRKHARTKSEVIAAKKVASGSAPSRPVVAVNEHRIDVPGSIGNSSASSSGGRGPSNKRSSGGALPLPPVRIRGSHGGSGALPDDRSLPVIPA